MSGMLAHIRVLDLSYELSDGWIGKIFTDLGAELITLKRPAQQAAVFFKDEFKYTAYDAEVNCKTLTIDTNQDKGRDLLKQLVSQAAIVIADSDTEQVSGLDYVELSACNPRMIYCSVANHVTQDLFQAPTRETPDTLLAMHVGNCLLAALAQAERAKQGKFIELATILDEAMARQQDETMHTHIVPYQSFASADGCMILAVHNDEQFSRLCELLEYPSLAQDQRFASNSARLRHRSALIPLLATLLRQYSTDVWLSKLMPAGIPCGKLAADFDTADNDEQMDLFGTETTKISEIALQHMAII